MAQKGSSLPQDLVDLLAAFARADVRYLIIGGYPVTVMSRDDLIRSKRASGREQDLIDARNLERGRPREP